MRPNPPVPEWFPFRGRIGSLRQQEARSRSLGRARRQLRPAMQVAGCRERNAEVRTCRMHGNGLPRLIFPGFRDIRGYQAMYRDFLRSIRDGRAPDMSLERAMEDQRLMEQL